MATIQISLQEVQDTANQLRSLNMLMDEELNAMKSEMNRLDSSWISDGSLEIRNKFNLFSSRFEKQKETINQYAKFLDLAVSSYDTLETTITSNASGMQV
ncbi:MAG: pore-forming ESAT-6 family protein [Bulleidia sp.]|nr:pore-forming ESAT-6 family protein [Erysipelotrichaceae bacterium]MDY3660704.1 pore-forming ESAT-6 family protein [Bulleidia sp.]